MTAATAPCTAPGSNPWLSYLDRRGVHVEAAPAHGLKTKAGQDGRRHRTAPDHESRHLRLARHLQPPSHHSSIHAEAAEPGPHGASVDDRALGGYKVRPALPAGSPAIVARMT